MKGELASKVQNSTVQGHVQLTTTHVIRTVVFSANKAVTLLRAEFKKLTQEKIQHVRLFHHFQ